MGKITLKSFKFFHLSVYPNKSFFYLFNKHRFFSCKYFIVLLKDDINNLNYYFMLKLSINSFNNHTNFLKLLITIRTLIE